MEVIKVMPCLDMKNGRVVKGINFVNLRDAGDPVENAAFYEKEGADELAMLDIAATLENRKTRLEWVKNVSSVIKMPLTVGGGIATLEDIELVLDAGAAKISMNSAAVNSPGLVRQAAKAFGSEKVTVAIDGKRNASMPSGFELVIAGGTKPVGRMLCCGPKNARTSGRGPCCRPAWMVTAHRRAMIWHLPGRFPMPSAYRSLPRGALENWSISTKPSPREVPRFCSPLRFSITALSVSGRSRNTSKAKACA